MLAWGNRRKSEKASRTPQLVPARRPVRDDDTMKIDNKSGGMLRTACQAQARRRKEPAEDYRHIIWAAVPEARFFPDLPSSAGLWMAIPKTLPPSVLACAQRLGWVELKIVAIRAVVNNWQWMSVLDRY